MAPLLSIEVILGHVVKLPLVALRYQFLEEEGLVPNISETVSHPQSPLSLSLSPLSTAFQSVLPLSRNLLFNEPHNQFTLKEIYCVA